MRRAASFDAALDAASAALDRLAGRGDWLLWVDLAALIPPWDTPEEFLAPYFQAEAAENEEEEEELEPLTPLNDPTPGPVDAEDDELFLRLQDSYAGAVTHLDAGVGRLLERLDAVDAGDETLVVLTADCGLALGEHGHVGPAAPLAHEETTHLPLILCLPGGDEAGRRVAALTQAADLAATLADVFEAELPSAPRPDAAAAGVRRGGGGSRLRLFRRPGRRLRRSGVYGPRNGLFCCRWGRGRRGCTSSRTTAGK